MSSSISYLRILSISHAIDNNISIFFHYRHQCRLSSLIYLPIPPLNNGHTTDWLLNIITVTPLARSLPIAEYHQYADWILSLFLRLIVYYHYFFNTVSQSSFHQMVGHHKWGIWMGHYHRQNGNTEYHQHHHRLPMGNNTDGIPNVTTTTYQTTKMNNVNKRSAGNKWNRTTNQQMNNVLHQEQIGSTDHQQQTGMNGNVTNITEQQMDNTISGQHNIINTRINNNNNINNNKYQQQHQNQHVITTGIPPTMSNEINEWSTWESNTNGGSTTTTNGMNIEELPLQQQDQQRMYLAGMVKCIINNNNNIKWLHNKCRIPTSTIITTNNTNTDTILISTMNIHHHQYYLSIDCHQYQYQYWSLSSILAVAFLPLIINTVIINNK